MGGATADRQLALMPTWQCRARTTWAARPPGDSSRLTVSTRWQQRRRAFAHQRKPGEKKVPASLLSGPLDPLLKKPEVNPVFVVLHRLQLPPLLRLTIPCMCTCMHIQRGTRYSRGRGAEIDKGEEEEKQPKQPFELHQKMLFRFIQLVRHHHHHHHHHSLSSPTLHHLLPTPHSSFLSNSQSYWAPRSTEGG